MWSFREGAEDRERSSRVEAMVRGMVRVSVPRRRKRRRFSSNSRWAGLARAREGEMEVKEGRMLSLMKDLSEMLM
jgi:hypothetical protein